MQYFIICISALLASGLTFFSGFGLGTILLPVFAIFFPIDLAIVLTAIVHFLNNIFKLILVGKNADTGVVLCFGLPAIIAAFAGAYLLSFLSDMPAVHQYVISGKTFVITTIKIIIAVLLLIFMVIEMSPGFEKKAFSKKYLPAGGLLSGFFGGLSGHQGALRSAFLVKASLSKESFIATGIVIACMIDASRLTVYSGEILRQGSNLDYPLIAAATLSAFTGAYGGNILVKKITIRMLQRFVGIMIGMFAIMLGAGLI